MAHLIHRQFLHLLRSSSQDSSQLFRNRHLARLNHQTYDARASACAHPYMCSKYDHVTNARVTRVEPLEATMSLSQLESCTVCSYCTIKPNHVYTIHRHEPNFIIYCSCCMRSYKKLSVYRKHVSRGCKVPLAKDTTEEQRSLLPSSPELQEGDTYDSVTEQYSDPGVENPTICGMRLDLFLVLRNSM